MTERNEIDNYTINSINTIKNYRLNNFSGEITSLQVFNKYLDNTVYFIQCNGMGCRLNVFQGRGVHCESCYGSRDDIIEGWSDDLLKQCPFNFNPLEDDEYFLINCYGNDCKHYAEDGEGIHCESCYGKYEGVLRRIYY